MELISLVMILLAFASALALIAEKIRIPHPILLVIGGALLGFVPNLPRYDLDPDLVFLFFLPPLLYWSALRASLRDFKQDKRAIGLLSTVMVLVIAVGTGFFTHWLLPSIPLPVAMVLGAVVSPTDAIAALSVSKRFNVPRRIVTIIDGECLVNDATGLVLYRFALAAVLTGAFSLLDASLHFLLEVGGGIVVGLVMGWLVAGFRKNIPNHPSAETVFSLLTPYVAFLPANAVHVSGVLATVTMGFYLGWRGPNIVAANTRLQTGMMWETHTFILNNLVFILLGLQLNGVIHHIEHQSLSSLFLNGFWISLAVILIRLVWVFPAAYVPRWINQTFFHQDDPYPPWQNVFIVGWAGMRGMVSLAAALAIPLSLPNGMAFPARDFIIFATYNVIFYTLVIQGMSLPWVIKWLKLRDDNSLAAEEHRARIATTQSALARLENLIDEVTHYHNEHEAVVKARREYEYRLNLLYDRANPEVMSVLQLPDAPEDEWANIMRHLIVAEREQVVADRNQGVIPDDVLHRLLRELDLREMQLAR